MSRPRIQDSRPSLTDWTGTGGATENPRQSSLSFTAQTGARSDHKNLTIDFGASFDDSVYGNTRVWLLNDPGADLAWEAIYAASASTPADTSIAGDTMGGSPGQAALIDSSVAYDSGTKDLGFVQVQMDATGASAAFDTGDEMRMNPVLVFDILRGDPANPALRPDISGVDEGEGYLFTYSDVELYEEDSTQSWTYIGSIREETFDITLATETVEWAKSKPRVIVQQAVSALNANASFQLDQVDPRWLARSLDTAALANSSDDSVDVVLDGRPRATLTQSYVLQWRTYGGHVVRLRLPRARLTPTGSFRPGDTQFAGMTFQLTGMASGADRQVAILSTSAVPVEQMLVPLNVTITTP
jgi:hypothetical protein